MMQCLFAWGGGLSDTSPAAAQALQRLFMVELMLGAAARSGGGGSAAPRLPDSLRGLCAEAWQDRLYRSASASTFQQHVRERV